MPTPTSFPVTFESFFIRPSIETPWFHDTWPPSHMEYINALFKDEGSEYYGRYKGSRVESPDKLTLITTYTFDDEAVFLKFTTDPYLVQMNENREAYNLAHDIVRFT